MNRVLLVPAGVAAVLASGLAVYPMASASAGTPAVFSGSASASGVIMTVTVPGAPATDTPIDGGGPTAQVAVSSLGSSAGYAAFPDPSQFFVSLPALAQGVAAGGAGGLPPATLPNIPPYPFSVSSDVNTTPSAEAGSGPYRITSKSATGSSTATATSGANDNLLGSAALADSQASVASSADGVVSSATSILKGLAVGPLSIGYIESKASQTLDSSGATTPFTDLKIGGMRIGGVPVEVSPQGFNAAGTVSPVAMDKNLADVLKQAGITLTIVAAQTYPDRVVAPALRITAPFAFPAVPNVGEFRGTMTTTIGFATAQLTGAGSGDAVSSPASSGTGSGVAPSTTGSGINPAPGLPVTDFAGASGATLPTTDLTTGQPGAATGNSGVDVSLAAGGGVVPGDGFDTRRVYLLLAVGALMAFGLGHIISRSGVRA